MIIYLQRGRERAAEDEGESHQVRGGEARHGEEGRGDRGDRPQDGGGGREETARGRDPEEGGVEGPGGREGS